jgi:beta-fructofuranosidase
MTWEAMEPLVASGEYGHMECPQLIDIDDRFYLLFSVYSWAHSDLRKARIEPVTGTHYLVADSPTGPFGSLTDTFFSGSPAGHAYAGKIIEDPDGRPVYLAFEQHDQDGHFLRTSRRPRAGRGPRRWPPHHPKHDSLTQPDPRCQRRMRRRASP